MKPTTTIKAAWALAVIVPALASSPTYGWQALMTSQLASPTALPGSTVDVYLFVQDVTNVRAYQTRISIQQTSGTGTVSVECPLGTPDPNVRIEDTRPDFIYFGVANVFSSTNCPNRSAAVARLFGGSTVGATPAYLTTYTLTVSPDAEPGSTFEISIDPAPDSNMGDPSNQPIPFNIGAPSVLTIESPEQLTFVTTFCSNCLPVGEEAIVELHVSGLQEPINGVQTLFSFDPAVLDLSGVMMGDGEGSPWDAATLVFLGDTDGDATLAVSLNGNSTQADAVVARLSFTTVGTGTSSIDFRTSPPPFATKLTTAAANSTILPGTNDSGEVIVGLRSKGDINGDGFRDGLDIQRFSEILMNPGGATAEEFCAAELSGDGEVTVEQDSDLLIDCLIADICVCP